MIKIQHQKSVETIYLNPQHITEVRVSITKEPREDGGENIYSVYRVFLLNEPCEISSKDYNTEPLRSWLSTATSHLSTTGKMLY